MPASSPDQSAGAARSGKATGSTPALAGIDDGSRAAALTCQPSFASAPQSRRPIKPEAPGASTRPFMSAALGQGMEHQAGRRQAEPEAHGIDGEVVRQHRADGEQGKQHLEQKDPRT